MTAFVPLAELLRGRGAQRDDVVEDVPAAEDPVAEAQPRAGRDDATSAVGEPTCEGSIEALREARLFRARLLDAFDEAASRMLRELAARVLARELRAAPCDLDAVVAEIARAVPVVRVRVAPGDVTLVRGIPAVADDTLHPGDAIVELVNADDDGTAAPILDARLGVRLAAVFEAFA